MRVAAPSSGWLVINDAQSVFRLSDAGNPCRGYVWLDRATVPETGETAAASLTGGLEAGRDFRSEAMASAQRSRPTMSPMFRMALASGSAAAVLLHLRRGADPEGRDGGGSTPLMIAAARGRLEVCELLIAEGVDLGATDAMGRDSIALAQAGRHQRLVDLLSAHAPVPAVVPPHPPSAPSKPADSSRNPLPEHEADQGDLGLWEPEAEVARPANDALLVEVAAHVQLALAKHRAVDHDTDWSDVVVELPLPAVHQRNDPVLRRLFERLAKLIGAGLLEGAIGETALEAAVALAAGDAAEPARIRTEAVLAALTDLGIGLDEDANWRAGARVLPGPAPLVDDVRALVDSIESTADVLSAFYRELGRQPPLTPDDERRLWRSLDDEAVRLGTVALATPALLQPLVAELERQSVKAAEASERHQREGRAADAEAPSGVEVAAAVARAQLIDQLAKRVSEEGVGPPPEEEARIDLPRLFRRLHPSADALASLCHALLTARTAEGDEVARAVLDRIASIRTQAIRSHLKLVIWWARRHPRRGLELADLIQEGSIGLMKAVGRYEWVRGHKFSTYASWWIRQAITRALADGEHLIRRPVHLSELLTRLSRARTALTCRLQREPTVDELAVELGEKADRLGQIMARISEVVPLSEATDDGGEVVAQDLAVAATAFSEVARKELRTITTKAFACLSPREERILRLRFGFNQTSDHTLEECGEIFGVTRERVRQIEAKALRKLKTPIGARQLLRTFAVG